MADRTPEEAFQLAKRYVAARRRNECPAKEDCFAVADAMECELSDGTPFFEALGLQPEEAERIILADRDATIRLEAAAIAGSNHHKAAVLDQRYTRHPWLRPMGRLIRFDAIRKILGKDPRVHSPTGTVQSRHEHDAPPPEGSPVPR